MIAVYRRTCRFDRKNIAVTSGCHGGHSEVHGRQVLRRQGLIREARFGVSSRAISRKPACVGWPNIYTNVIPASARTWKQTQGRTGMCNIRFSTRSQRLPVVVLVKELPYHAPPKRLTRNKVTSNSLTMPRTLVDTTRMSSILSRMLANDATLLKKRKEPVPAR